MKSYTIPHTDLEVSRLAYGCMRTGRTWDELPLEAKEGRNETDIFLAAFDAGYTFFDHADIYGRGRSEEIFAGLWDARPGIREKIIVQSKCGVRPGFYDFRYDHIVGSVEGSLRRLRTEYLDILLLHRTDVLIEPDEVARAFNDLHRMGKVRYFGVSNHEILPIQLLQEHLDHRIVVNQMRISLLHHYLINETIVVNTVNPSFGLGGGLLEYCRLKGILLQAWSPVDHGRTLNPPDDADEGTKAIAAAIANMAEEKGTTREAVALGWLLRHPAGIQPIVGTTNVDRVRASARADDIEISHEEWYALFATARGDRVR